ncbi:hypothetical protein LZ32DRAFT_213185 [Colletotrichum eremochloae]|nr:hypothetical protein LZ32DRAFT_213185 [Colletotrichum eremochloae]
MNWMVDKGSLQCVFLFASCGYEEDRGLIALVEMTEMQGNCWRKRKKKAYAPPPSIGRWFCTPGSGDGHNLRFGRPVKSSAIQPRLISVSPVRHECPVATVPTHQSPSIPSYWCRPCAVRQALGRPIDDGLAFERIPP